MLLLHDLEISLDDKILATSVLKRAKKKLLLNTLQSKKNMKSSHSLIIIALVSGILDKIDIVQLLHLQDLEKKI